MNYPDSVRFLYALGNEVKTARLGLERIGILLEALGNPQQACPIVHVAGTNGKGSTCAMIESGLRAAGYRTGLFTSPHLVEPTERIQVAGSPLAQTGLPPRSTKSTRARRPCCDRNASTCIPPISKA